MVPEVGVIAGRFCKFAKPFEPQDSCLETAGFGKAEMSQLLSFVSSLCSREGRCDYHGVSALPLVLTVIP